MERTTMRGGWIAVVAVVLACCGRVAAGEAPPNVIVIFADDMAYADLGCSGAKGYTTPHFDTLAADGMRFTDFYVSSPVCSASRAALLTGCYHERVSIRGALGPASKICLNPEETTLAELLKARGYATGMAGKWHLGSTPKSLPTAHGFDEFFGLPYSADMWPFHPENPKAWPPLPLYEGTTKIDAEVSADVQKTLTGAFAKWAVEFIRKNKDRPFFFYFAPNMPHVPLFVQDANLGKSGAGLYGDVMRELDDAIGAIRAALEETGTARNTLIVFTSDNGPWLSYGNHAGSAGPLREGKGTCYEGGIRVPMLACWPGKIPAGSVCREPAMTIDVFPTVAALTGAQAPEKVRDGKDLSPLLLGTPGAKSPHAAYAFYYGNGQLQALRSGNWKILFPHTARTMNGQAPGKDGQPGKYKPLPVGLELYDLSTDLGETRNLAAEKPEVVAELQKLAEGFRADLGDGLTNRKGSGVRPAGTTE